MLLLLDNAIFYEFMPLSEIDSDYPKTLLLNEGSLKKIMWLWLPLHQTFGDMFRRRYKI